jgi:transcriptional regulator with XRE-family HTH domain
MPGITIKNAVKYSGFRQREFSKKLGLSENTLFYYMSERTKPTYEIIQKIAEKCDVDLEWLTTGKIIPAPIAHTFKRLIDCTGLSIKDFAAKLNKPESFINAILNMEIWPSKEFLDKALVVFEKDNDFYEPQNVLNKFKRRTDKFREQYPDIIDWIYDKNEKEFQVDFNSLVNRWRRIKSLEQKQQ